MPIKFEFIFKKIAIKLPRAILLYGPPGCGKTFIAHSVANELGLNYFSVYANHLLNSYVK
jgi:ATP-dependent 26S proteasome regulatory subunit